MKVHIWYVWFSLLVVGSPPRKEDWSCAQGFSEAHVQWNKAYNLWKHATLYHSDADMYSDYKDKNKNVAGDPNGELSLADALELDFSLPNKVPE